MKYITTNVVSNVKLFIHINTFTKQMQYEKIIRFIKLKNFHRDFVHNVKTSRKISLKVIGSGALGETPSICLVAPNNHKYLFNCGEDSQRLLSDQNVNISQIKYIFITQTKWNCIGGIASICYLIHNVKNLLPTLNGPEQLYKCIKRVLCLSKLSELDFKPIDCNQNSFFEDDTLRIDFVSIAPKQKKSRNLKANISNEVLAFVGKIKTPIADHSLAQQFMSKVVLF